MTYEQMATTLELALYRVGDRLAAKSDAESQLIGNTLREVADEFHNITIYRRSSAFGQQQD